MKDYRIEFEVDVISPKSKTLSVGRKNGTSNFTSDLSEAELWDHKNDVAQMIAKDLTQQGIMLFNSPEIKSIKLKAPKRLKK